MFGDWKEESMMTVTVKLFAWLADCAGTGSLELALAPGSRAADAKMALSVRFPEISPLLPYVKAAVNQDYQHWDFALTDGDELALIPPVSGG